MSKLPRITEGGDDMMGFVRQAVSSVAHKELLGEVKEALHNAGYEGEINYRGTNQGYSMFVKIHIEVVCGIIEEGPNSDSRFARLVVKAAREIEEILTPVLNRHKYTVSWLKEEDWIVTSDELTPTTHRIKVLTSVKGNKVSAVLLPFDSYKVSTSI